MLRHISALASGLLFGFGLVISGMVNPAKVKNFLDLGSIGSSWDPSLLFVMAGAISVTLPGYRLLSNTKKPKFAKSFHWPTRQDIDVPLVRGAVFFGMGWALSGLCPGPAIASLSTLNIGLLAFFIMFTVGTVIAYHQERLSD